MKTSRFIYTRLWGVMTLFCPFVALADVHQAWISKYANLNQGTNQAVALALDPTGNIVICGASQNSSSNLDYVTLRYQPNGSQMWAAAFDSTNKDDVPRGLAVDTNGNTVVTGTSVTVKYSPAGQQLWTAPYGGRGVAIDSNADVYVTGYLETQIATAKLAANSGSNKWSKLYPSTYHVDFSQVIATDNNANVYVAGQTATALLGSKPTYYAFAPVVIAYTSSGQTIFSVQPASPPDQQDAFGGIAADLSTNCYTTHMGYDAFGFITSKYTNSGRAWLNGPDDSAGAKANGLALGASGSVYSAGYTSSGRAITVFKANPDGSPAWERYAKAGPSASAAAIALDANENVYVTGYAGSSAISNDIVTIKYDKDGNQQWIQTYDGPAHGDDRGVAIAVNKVGDVYVAGYETVLGGGTQIVLVKYTSQKIERHADGTIHLEYPGVTGQSYAFQATTDFSAWDVLGSSIADTNNIATFDDTNAPLYPSRFYRTFGP
jgi:hypothetical protein